MNLTEDDLENEAAELDLGTKIKTPKDVMLEELSLMKNKGSKMFKMRQQRVERFIVTNENMVRVQTSNGPLMVICCGVLSFYLLSLSSSRTSRIC